MPDPTPATELATDTVDSHGSTLQFCSTGEEVVDKFLPGIDVIPQVNSGKQFEDDTDIGMTRRSYYEKALPEDQDFELVMRDIPGNADQKAFTDQVEAGTNISMKITRASGRVIEFVLVPQDYFSGESGKETGKQMFACIGKLQNVNFSSVSAGA
ncbi:hypothetical protein NQS96_07680 [Pseudoalteromonas shioyasakiensis]|uniref:hypothetical protein n=1 Tax=Pseudoalteromonas shioyasakiensis TaxID=1190813 RepID=UPI0007B952DE|nr:hypothetical protein [Pseudoalteromonas shioyasakiensis]KZY47370.1 hypothetical protein A3733_11365 [Pseudoalteromonas shioyasakiensis]MCQ8881676.1 hypothetical protein [Pseudoalteromonas shioyasakiensis]